MTDPSDELDLPPSASGGVGGDASASSTPQLIAGLIAVVGGWLVSLVPGFLHAFSGEDVGVAGTLVATLATPTAFLLWSRETYGRPGRSLGPRAPRRPVHRLAWLAGLLQGALVVDHLGRATSLSPVAWLTAPLGLVAIVVEARARRARPSP